MVLKLLFYKGKKTETDANKNQIIPYSLVGFIGSFVSSITGLGGGLVFTPAFLSILKVPAKKVSSYSNLAMLVATLFGILPHFFTEMSQIYFSDNWIQNSFIGNVNLSFIFIIALGGFVSSKLGIYLNNITSERTKKYLLAATLSVFAMKLLY